MLSEQMKQDGIGILTGHAKPSDGEYIDPQQEGFVQAAAGLVEAGYGQHAISGITQLGLVAELKKPPFSRDLERNERQQAKPRQLRVYIEDDQENEDEIRRLAAQSLIQFYNDAG